jgi:hypothetical protein
MLHFIIDTRRIPPNWKKNNQKSSRLLIRSNSNLFMRERRPVTVDTSLFVVWWKWKWGTYLARKNKFVPRHETTSICPSHTYLETIGAMWSYKRELLCCANWTRDKSPEDLLAIQEKADNFTDRWEPPIWWKYPGLAIFKKFLFAGEWCSLTNHQGATWLELRRRSLWHIIPR